MLALWSGKVVSMVVDPGQTEAPPTLTQMSHEAWDKSLPVGLLGSQPSPSVMNTLCTVQQARQLSRGKEHVFFLIKKVQKQTETISKSTSIKRQ
jgi:hypothetical protein